VRGFTKAAERERWRSGALLLGLCASLAGPAGAVRAAADGDGEDGEKLYRAGQYAQSIEAARQVLRGIGPRLEARLLLTRALLTTGQRKDAANEAQGLVDHHPESLRALRLAYEVFRRTGDARRADGARGRLQALVNSAGNKIEDAAELVAAGESALVAGDEPKTVLSTYFEQAVKKDPRCRPAYLAAGALALAKHDDALAADWFRRGIQRLGPDPDLHAGLARAYYGSDRKQMTAALDAALHLNPRHPGALLLRAEHELDGEDYPAARRTLEKVLAVDAGEPSAWAFQAVLAHLASDAAAEERARGRALAAFPTNPEVDALIGRKLSEKYRFVEGSAAERRALALDPAYLPAKIQLAQDLLRLGKEAEGWKLAEEVHAQDAYDVVAFNLTTLRAHREKLPPLKQGELTVRMDGREATVYGDEVLALLREARAQVDRKYGFTNPHPVEVEIFPEQSDFAVRTFGMPGGAGYLGVCFGNLITMNSPAGSGAAQVAWRSVLWHEYTHVVTLGLTRNRIPRWLSEGISVHEELERDRTWGQAMTPRYREMILGEDLTPVGKLSSAFLSPRTPEHLMFAYYESALVVEFLVARFGHPALLAILKDLGAGVEINRALAAHTVPLPELEKAFAAAARKRAQELAPQADFAEPDPAALARGDAAALARWRARHPASLWALQAEAKEHLERGEWQRAKAPLERLIALYPGHKGAESPYLLLALAHRKLGETAEEKKTLERLAGLASDAVPAYTRLMELAEAGGDLPALGANADRLLAVNPMAAGGWRGRGRAEEGRAGGDRAAGERAVAAYEKLLALEPADQADTHYRLGKLLKERNPRLARRHLLDALAEAPRFREGHRLLLELEGAR
jgi:tetratricopeptide (TPR) repeat protein